VLVDEYQDTNRAQLLMVKVLVADHGNLCVVGDDDQSIYAWRGADTSNILAFESAFPGARVITLEQNYRSTPTILAAANAVIANNPDRRGKTLWSDRRPGAAISVALAPDADGEARFVAAELSRLRSETSRRHSDFAVLYRSNVQTRPLEEALREAGIPYTIYGGQQFYERKEVKDLIAYLRLALNPRDEISLRRVINVPPRGVGATTVERLGEWAHANAAPMWQALSDCGGIGSRPRQGIQQFATAVEVLRSALEAGTSVAAATRRLIADIALYEDIRSGSPSITAAQRRIDNAESLVRSLEQHEQRAPGRSALAEYLRRLSLDTADADATERAGDRVVLTTLHGAKGLEFPIVFLIGMEEELLPHHRTLMPTASDVSDPEHASDISEERRLAYVGITRAQDQLTITRCAARVVRGKLQPRTPSRFLQEIPRELIEERDVEAEATAPVEVGDLAAFFSTLSSTE
jgi:DNA helicase-2/ATP-dependent DNA helicase PcrA